MSDSTFGLSKTGYPLAEIVAFSVVGIAATTQHLTSACSGQVGGDLELVAEESLAICTVTSTRVLEVELADYPELGQIVPGVVAGQPLRYYDYIIGSEMLASEGVGQLPSTDEIYDRLHRKLEFYTAHFPGRTYPGPKLLKEKLILWMGRISSPGLHEHPEERLVRLELTGVLERHLTLIRQFTRQQVQALDPSEQSFREE